MGSRQVWGAVGACRAVPALGQGPGPSLLQQPRAGEGSLQADMGNLVSAELLVLGAGTAWAAHSGVGRSRQALNDHREAPTSPEHGAPLGMNHQDLHSADISYWTSPSFELHPQTLLALGMVSGSHKGLNELPMWEELR